MNVSFLSIIRVLVLVIMISGVILGVSAECSCKNKEMTAKLTEAESDTGNVQTTPLNNTLNLQSSAVPSLNESGVSHYSAVSPSSASGCRPSVDNTSPASEAAWPSPLITSLYPSSVGAGSGPITLTVDGNYFIPETRILWDARDYTRAYLSTYQMLAEIPEYELGTPGTHYIWAFNPDPCGGNSNISQFPVYDAGKSVILQTLPLQVRVIPGQEEPAGILVQNLTQGLLRYNLTIIKEQGAPFSFAFESIPSWVTDQQITWINENQIQVIGTDGNERITNTSGDTLLVNLSIYGTGTGSGQLQCFLNEVIADNGERYGKGYTAIPVLSRQLLPFPKSANESYSVPTDIDTDGRYEDVNGNHRLDFSDIVLYFMSTGFITGNEPWWVFDYDQNGLINLHDAVTLFEMM